MYILRKRTPTYTGPGDVVSGWTMWWGLRAFSAAVAATGTQKAINVRRASDNTTADIVILSTGFLDTATAAAFAPVDATGIGSITGTTLTFTGGHIGDVVTGGTTLPGTIIRSGSSPTWTVNLSQTVASAMLTLTWGLFVTKWYDQSGNGNDLLQATNAAQPQLLLVGGPSGGPSLQFLSTATQGLSTAGSSAPPAVSAVAIRTANFTTTQTICGGDSNQIWVAFKSSANAMQMSQGNVGFVNETATDNVWHAVNCTFNTSNSFINVDNSSTTGNAGNSSGLSPVVVGLPLSPSCFALTGGMVEAGRPTAILSSGQATSLNTNQHGTNGWNF